MSLIEIEETSQDEHDYPLDDYNGPVDLALAKYVDENDVTLVYFNNSGVEAEPSELANISTKVLIHGWLTSIQKSPWYPLLKDAYIKENEPINVIYVDYSKQSSELYSIVSATIPKVAEIIADKLMKTKIHESKLHLIGHSLGAHVAGFIGREIHNFTGGKVARITVLDAAGPKFDKSPIRVSKDDAMFVDVIHTDDGHYGTTLCLGHVDIFPNGGKLQPGCLTDDNCSHARSTRYFAESIGKRPRVCKRAASWEDYLNGNTSNDPSEIFGEYVSHQARGNYYLVTNNAEPYFGTRIEDKQFN